RIRRAGVREAATVGVRGARSSRIGVHAVGRRARTLAAVGRTRARATAESEGGARGAGDGEDGGESVGQAEPRRRGGASVGAVDAGDDARHVGDCRAAALVVAGGGLVAAHEPDLAGGEIVAPAALVIRAAAGAADAGLLALLGVRDARHRLAVTRIGARVGVF